MSAYANGARLIPMRLVSLTRVKIDGDIIEEFVRYTARFVDHLYVVDNASLDGTRATLDALAAEGLPLTILRDEVVELDYERLMTMYARQIFAEQKPDFILVLDADEFVIADDRPAFESALRVIPEGAHASIPWMTYVPTVDDDVTESRVLVRMRHRLATEQRQYFKTIVSRSFANHPQWWITAGAHAIGTSDVKPNTVDLAEIALAHFPVREIKQMQAKALLGWSTLLAKGYDEESGIAFQWRKLYYRLLADHCWTSDDLYRFALDYLVEENCGCAELRCAPLLPVARRHTGPVPDLLDVALRFSRQLALAYAEARGTTTPPTTTTRNSSRP